MNLDPFLQAENQGLGQPGSALKAAVPRPFLRTATDSLVALLCRSSEGRDCADLLLCIVHPQSQLRPAAEEGLLSERTAPRPGGNHGTKSSFRFQNQRREWSLRSERASVLCLGPEDVWVQHTQSRGGGRGRGMWGSSDSSLFFQERTPSSGFSCLLLLSPLCCSKGWPAPEPGLGPLL